MRPSVSFLSQDMIKKIIDQAYDILCQKGVMFENASAINILAQGGAHVDRDTNLVLFTRDVIEKMLRHTCSTFRLFDSSGENTHKFENNNVHFTPGSSALYFLEGSKEIYRKPVTADYTNYTKVVSQLQAIGAQSTAFIPSDVPDKISDSYRLFLSLLYCKKPVVTGVFRVESFEVMKNFLLVVMR